MFSQNYLHNLTGTSLLAAGLTGGATERHVKNKEHAMNDWVPFAEGKYLVEQAYLVTPDDTAVTLEEVIIDVYTGAGGRRRMRGSCPVQNMLIVAIHEEHDELDLLLDLGGAFKYILRKPTLQAGKVFAPKVKSLLHFVPAAPLEPVAAVDFDRRVSGLNVLTG